LTGFYNYVHYRSIQGRDRFQSWLTDDSPLQDSRKHYGLSLEIRIPRTLYSVAGSIEGVKRWGQVHELEGKLSRSEYFIGLKYRF